MRACKSELLGASIYSVCQIDDYSLVSFVPLDLTKEDSIAYMLQHVDGAIQYGEDADVRTSSVDA